MGPSWFWAFVIFTVFFGPFLLCDAGVVEAEDIKRRTHVMRPGVEKHIDEGVDFQMFCRVGEKKYVGYYFRTATLRITSAAEDIKLIKGHSPKDVYLQHTESTKWLLWIANVLPWRARDTNFPTFNTSCVGISTTRPYTAMIIIRPVDPWKVLTLAAGMTLFFMAPNLSQSTLFFYSSGTLLGGLAAALVLLFILTRFLPKRKSGYLMIGLLWTMAFYFAGETWKRFEELLHERLPYIVAYLFTGALVAFLACYRWGPPQHPRTLDIIRWSLQITGLVLIHFSSDFVEMSTALIILVITYHHSNACVKYYAERYYRRWFPTHQRLLTEEEFITQGAVETQKSLLELKKFCASPEAEPWKLISRLKNPRRFSGFMEGRSHLNDDEILAYDSEDMETYRRNSRRSLPAPASAIVNRISDRTLLSINNGSVPATNDMVVTDDDEESDGIRVDDEIETDDED